MGPRPPYVIDFKEQNPEAEVQYTTIAWRDTDTQAEGLLRRDDGAGGYGRQNRLDCSIAYLWVSKNPQLTPLKANGNFDPSKYLSLGKRAVSHDWLCCPRS